MSEKIAVCPGSFDPITYGHMNIIKRGFAIFDRIIVAVAFNISKKTTFTVEERVSIIQDLFHDEARVTVDAFDGLLVDYVVRKKAVAVLRGIRTVTDYENEMQMALTNKMLNPQIESVLMMTDGAYSHISSSNIKEIVKLGGNAESMVPKSVQTLLRRKFAMK